MFISFIMVPNSKWQLVKKLHLQKHWHKPVSVVIDLRHINKALICSYWDCKYISLTKPLIVCCLDLKKLCLIKSKTVKNGASRAPLSLPAQTFVNHYWLFDSRTVTQFVFIQTVLYFIIIINWTVCPFYRLVQHQWQNSCFLGYFVGAAKFFQTWGSSDCCYREQTCSSGVEIEGGKCICWI